MSSKHFPKSWSIRQCDPFKNVDLYRNHTIIRYFAFRMYKSDTLFVANNILAHTLALHELSKSCLHTSIGSRCNMLSTSEHVSIVCSALQIDFDCNKWQCSWGSTKHVSCHNKVNIIQIHISTLDVVKWVGVRDG